MPVLLGILLQGGEPPTSQNSSRPYLNTDPSVRAGLGSAFLFHTMTPGYTIGTCPPVGVSGVQRGGL